MSQDARSQPDGGGLQKKAESWSTDKALSSSTAYRLLRTFNAYPFLPWIVVTEMLVPESADASHWLKAEAARRCELIDRGTHQRPDLIDMIVRIYVSEQSQVEKRIRIMTTAFETADGSEFRPIE